MANKKLFNTKATVRPQKLTLPATNVVNAAGGTAYKMDDKHALAQITATGCFGSTFYISEKDQLSKVKELAEKVSPEFLAKVAIYSRQKGFMKDMPAYLASVLASKDATLLRKVFDRVIDDGKMVKNFVQIIRSGVTGRKSLGSVPKKLINKWLNSQSAQSLLRASIGNDPSLSDVIKMTHPTPKDHETAALFGYLTGKEAANPAEDKPLVQKIYKANGKSVVVHRYDPSNLPTFIKNFENFKATRRGEIPDVDFRLLDNLKLSSTEWAEVAKKANWHTTRMNLNTFLRHGVFNISGMDKIVADKLSDAATISKIKVFPYQLLAAYLNVEPGVPAVITNALQDAMEHATQNVPEINGKVYVFTDVSGSMRTAPITGQRDVESKIKAVNVAALISAAVLRKNPTAEVIPFHETVVGVRLNPRDSVMTNTNTLMNIPSGGTNCSAPLAHLNAKGAKGDLCIMVSDNESWMDSTGHGHGPCAYMYGTQFLAQWNTFKSRNPSARLVCIDLTPNTSVQAINRDDILNIGGFSDNVFEIISLFAKSGLGSVWTDVIESINLG